MSTEFSRFSVGQIFESKIVTVTEDAIVAFARDYDPQPFHLDRDAAKSSAFGELVASGWQTAAWTMRMMVDLDLFGAGGVGMGVDELRWRHPVRPGDTLQVTVTIASVVASPGRPHTVVRLGIATRNQDGTVVLTQTAIVRLARPS
jgi:acyl dehydratase